MIDHSGFIANDVMDLKDPFNRKSFSNPRYLNKVMTDHELSSIARNKHFSILPSLFWTAKETGYKLMVKRGLRKRFIPLDFEVSYLDEIEVGTNAITMLVHFNQCSIITRSEFTDDYIHTWTNVSTLRNRVVQTTITQTEMLATIAIQMDEYPNKLRIEKETVTGIPHLIADNGRRSYDFSMSHDGDYISYAYNPQPFQANA